MSFFFAGGMAILGGTATYLNGKATNASAEAGQENTRRRYLLKGKNAENQIEEQKSLAMEKMTEVSRQFFKTKGTMEAVRSETMVTGNLAQRLKNQARTDASEAKGQVAKVTNANIVNIAQDMIAEKVDSEAMLMELENKKKSSMQLLLDSGLSAASSFVGAGGMSGFTTSTTGTKKGV